MTIEGCIAVNVKTNEILTHDDDDCEFNYIFTNVYELCDYVTSQNLKLDDYLVHHVEGEVFELTATTKVCD